jgi:hypothetical protein
MSVSRGAKSGCRAAWRDYTQRRYDVGNFGQRKLKDEENLIEAWQASVKIEAQQVIV